MDSIRLAGLFILTATAIISAQVPLSQEPRHRETFASAQLRILNVTIPPGDTSLDHRHDFDIATVAMSGGASTRQQATGQPWEPARTPRQPGDPNVTEYTGKPSSHRVENIGKIAYQLFAVENLRDAKSWSAAPPVSALATRLATDGRALRIYDVRLATPTSQTTHTHAVPTVAVLINGIVMSEGPDAQAKALAPAPVGLKRLDSPGQWVLIPRGETHTVVRLGNVDARLMEIEIR